MKGTVIDREHCARTSFFHALLLFSCVSSHFFFRSASFRHATSLSLPPIGITGSEAPLRPPTIPYRRASPHPAAAPAHGDTFGKELHDRWPNATHSQVTGEPCSFAVLFIGIWSGWVNALSLVAWAVDPVYKYLATVCIHS